MLKVLILNALLYGFALTAEPEDQKQRKRGILQDGWVGIPNSNTYGHGQPWAAGETPWKPIKVHPVYHQQHNLEGWNHNDFSIYKPQTHFVRPESHVKPTIIKTFPVYITKHVVLEKAVPVPQPIYVREKVYVNKPVPVQVPVPVPQPLPIPVPIPFNPHFHHPHPHHPEFHGHFYPPSPYGPFDFGYGYGHGHGHGHGHGYGYDHGPGYYGHGQDYYHGHGHGHGHYSDSHENKDKHSEH